MKFWTLQEITTKVEADLDIQDETFIRPTELVTYINEAIDEAEAEIHSLYEDYFLKYVQFQLSSGDEFLSMPTLMPDIYADKVRTIMFRLNNSTTVYEVKRLRDSNKFAQKAMMDVTNSTDLYHYMMVNNIVGNPQIVLVPKSRESGTVTIWYLRNANRLSLSTDICDIPEFINFIFAHVKLTVYAKEGHPNMQAWASRLEQERERMTSVLATRVPDNANEIEMDTSGYDEMS